MRTVMNRESSIQVLAQDHATAGQRPPPTRLLDLVDLLIQLHRVIPIHHALMLDREDPVQISAPRRQECRPRLWGWHRKAAVEFCDVTLSQELIRLFPGADPRHSQLLRQPSLPGA